MLGIEHLTKNYGEKKAVDDLNLHIAPGEIYIDGKSIRTQPLECKRSFAYTGTVQSCGNTPKRLR